MSGKNSQDTQEYAFGSRVIPAMTIRIPMPVTNGRFRDSEGSMRPRRGDTLVGTLRQTYGEDFAPGAPSDMRLDALLEKEGVAYLAELISRT